MPPAILEFLRNSNSNQRLLPASKSISNRVLIIKKLSGVNFEINNISNAHDTVLMKNLLKKINSKSKFTELDTKNAGTVFRFLTSVCSYYEGKWLLTGNKRMRQRPVADLVKALELIGAKICYTNTFDFPPIIIDGGVINANETYIDASISSQFVSSLMLIAPYIKGGLTINLSNKIVSAPFINMTSEIMKYFGVNIHLSESKIIIPESKYIPKDFNVENDWTSASYFFMEAALTGNKIELNNLYPNSLQGDIVVCKIFEELGIKSFFQNNILNIVKTSKPPKYFEFNFSNCPDIFLSVAVTCAALNIKARLSGLDNLVYKECNRIDVFIDNIKQCGYDVNNINNSEIIINNNKKRTISHIPVIKTASDHRIAMSFAYLSKIIGKIIIDNPSVVSKSFPLFWENFVTSGFNMSYCK